MLCKDKFENKSVIDYSAQFYTLLYTFIALQILEIMLLF